MQHFKASTLTILLTLSASTAGCDEGGESEAVDAAPSDGKGDSATEGSSLVCERFRDLDQSLMPTDPEVAIDAVLEGKTYVADPNSTDASELRSELIQALDETQSDLEEAGRVTPSEAQSSGGKLPGWRFGSDDEGVLTDPNDVWELRRGDEVAAVALLSAGVRADALKTAHVDELIAVDDAAAEAMVRCLSDRLGGATQWDPWSDPDGRAALHQALTVIPEPSRQSWWVGVLEGVNDLGVDVVEDQITASRCSYQSPIVLENLEGHEWAAEGPAPFLESTIWYAEAFCSDRDVSLGRFPEYLTQGIERELLMLAVHAPAKWSRDVNWAFLLGAMDRRAEFFLASPLAGNRLNDDGEPTVFAQEYDFLVENGYCPEVNSEGAWLVPCA